MVATATMNTTNPAIDTSGTSIRLVETYPHPRQKVWRALTTPEIMQKWLMRPEGFAPVVGTRFRLVDDGPHRGWRGFVECEVLAVEPERLLRFSWEGDPGKVQVVTFRLDDEGEGGTVVSFSHEGFKGVGGFVLARLMMGPGWKRMLTRRIPAALAGGEIECSH